MPFETANKELAFVLKVEVSEPTARRYAEGAGAAFVAYQIAEVERLDEKCRQPRNGRRRCFSAWMGRWCR